MALAINEPPTDYAMALDSLRDALARIAELERERDDFKSRTDAACAVARAQGKTLDALRAENERLREAMEDADKAIDIASSDLRDGPCHYCGEMTEKHAGNPSRWPVYLCHADDPGKTKPHHAECVSERLAQRDRMADRMHTLGEERDAAVKLAAENEAAFGERDEAREALAALQEAVNIVSNAGILTLKSSTPR